MAGGIGEELQRAQYGKDLGESLNRIGSILREKRQSDEAAKTLRSLTGVDLSTPDGIRSFINSVFNLSQMGEAGQQGLQAANMGIVQPMLLQDQLEKQKIDRLKESAAVHNKNVENLHNDYRLPGLDVNAVDNRYQEALATYNAKLPQYKGHEELLAKPSPPAAYRVDDKVGSKILSDTYKGEQAPAGKNYTFIYSRQPNGKMGYDIARDTDGNPILADKPVSAGGGSVGITSIGDWSLVDPNADWNEAFLQSIPIDKRVGVKAIAEGRDVPASVASLMKGNMREVYFNLANAVNPQLRSGDSVAMKQVQKSFAAGGKDYQSVLALNQATGHIGELYDVVEELDNAPPTLWNKIANSGLKNVAGDDRVDRFNRLATLVHEELAKAFGGKPGTVAELEKFDKAFNSANSKASMRGVLLESLRAMKVRYMAEAEGWRSGTRLPVSKMSLDVPKIGSGLNLIYPQSKLVFHKLGLDSWIPEIIGGGQKKQDEGGFVPDGQ